MDTESGKGNLKGYAKSARCFSLRKPVPELNTFDSYVSVSLFVLPIEDWNSEDLQVKALTITKQNPKYIHSSR